MHRLPSPTPHIDAFVDGSIAWLVLNRPERRNAIDTAMWTAIPTLMKLFDDSADAKAIVIRGAGGDAFAAGADILEFEAARADAAAAQHYEQINGEAFAAIRSTAKPVIAMIEGFCIGGGLAVALACDLRLASHSAVFALPPARLGLAYPLDGLRDLVAAVGLSAAKEMIFSARRLTASDAQRIGLVEHVSDRVETDVRALCVEIAAGAPLTLTHSKRALDAIAGRPGHITEAEVASLAARCFDSADYAEGRAAFLEKRKPKFLGR
jgi:enoyl-CoA hydratase/carnithine racemase